MKNFHQILSNLGFGLNIKLSPLSFFKKFEWINNKMPIYETPPSPNPRLQKFLYPDDIMDDDKGLPKKQQYEAPPFAFYSECYMPAEKNIKTAINGPEHKKHH